MHDLISLYQDIPTYKEVLIHSGYSDISYKKHFSAHFNRVQKH